MSKTYVVCKRMIDALVENEDFLNIVSDRLMLDELLCGECDPKDFLKSQLKLSYIDYRTSKEIIREERFSRTLDEWSKV